MPVNYDVEHPQLQRKYAALADDVDRLLTHIAYLGFDVRDHADHADRSTESFVALPDHLQAMINERDEELDDETP